MRTILTGNQNNGLSPNVSFTFSEKLTASEGDICASIFKNLAESIRQQHPELFFDRLLHIIISDDVWATVSAMEKIVGRELPAARNGAESYLAFAVDMGQFDVLVYRIELINGFSNDHPRKPDSVWHYLSTLAEIHYYTVLKAVFTNDPWRANADQAELAIFGIAMQLLGSYWKGFFSFHPENAASAPFEELAEIVMGESKQIESAFIANENHSDASKLFSELHSSAMTVCGSMATVMGYCDAANDSIAKMSPQTWALILQWNFQDVWFKMAPIARMVFSNRHQWGSSSELLPLAAIPSYFIERCGTNFTSDGGTTPFRSIPIETKNLQ